MRPIVRVTATSVGSGIALTVTVVADSPEAAWRTCADQILKPFRCQHWHDETETAQRILRALRRHEEEAAAA